MQTKITIRNEAQTCYIDIEGIIGVPEESQFANSSSRVATFESFRREVERIAQVAATSVVVNIRSTGGDVNDALLIYEALRGLSARITTRCYGYTASAATIIAQAANEGCREISSNALYLIHNSTCAIEGNASTLESRAELLKKTDERLASLYALHSGRSEQEFIELMSENSGEGRWLTAEETIAAGLADKMIDSLLMGVELPLSEESAAEAEESAAATQDSEMASSTPSALASGVTTEVENLSKQELKQSLNSAAGVVVRYLLNRFAYRWEQWIEGMRERRQLKKEAKQAAKAKEHTATASTPAKESTVASGEEGATKQSTSPHSSASGVEASAKPQAAQAARSSAIAFDEGQRRYVASRVKPAEDPSMGRPHSLSNERAYDDDAKAFTR